MNFVLIIQGDGDKFVVGRVYTLPHLLPGARVLREGGNGTVLEVINYIIIEFYIN